MVTSRATLSATAALLISGAPSVIASTPTRELTPADAIATVRIMQNQYLPGTPITDSMSSPDGQRYLLRLAHGDVKRDGVWVDLLTGSLESLDAAARPRTCAHLFTTGLGSATEDQGANADPHPSNLVHWLNNREVAFLWTDRHDVRQVLSVDLISCKVKSLTKSPTSVYAFGIAVDGTVLYDARIARRPQDSSQLWARGFTLPDLADGWAVLRDDIEGGDISDVAFNNAWYIQSPSGATRALDIAGRHVDPTNPSQRTVTVAPDGRVALTYTVVPSLPDSWRGYSDPFLKTLFEVNNDTANRIPLRYALIDLHNGTVQTLWGAPKALHSQAAWSPLSDAVLLAPTFLPLTANSPAGLAGFAAAVVDVSTADYQPLPIDLTGRAVVSMSWASPTLIEICSATFNGADSRCARFHKTDHAWGTAAPDEIPLDPQPSSLHRPVRLEIRQSLNQPPQVWAVDSTIGASRLVLDLNPHLQENFKLGKVERISGTLPTGLQWLGQLIYPADYLPGKKYPLVIQSLYGQPWGNEEFTLDGAWGGSGMGLGPSAFPAYPGQLLATRNIAVLQLELLHPTRGVKEPQEHQLAFETLAEQLIASGLVDRNKIALDGFSRNGYWVEYTLAHSTFPFAAAIAADNYDPSYFQSALANWRVQDAEMNGAPAFGSGLQVWLAHAPGFNAEHIHTPLRMMGQSMGGVPYIIATWEIYSRLHYLHHPVELSVMPDINRHPSHNPQNPRQLMAIQESAIDWLSFWLTGREDPSPSKRPQYARWHSLRLLQASSTP